MRGSFRVYLQETLAEFCAKNPSYSLRSFALRLKVNHSTLSQLLRGKRRLTEKAIRDMGGRLNLDEAVIQSFINHEKRFPSNHTSREIQTQYAIMDLAVLPNFKPDVGWIARVLGVIPDEVNVALAQLLGMGRLQMTSTDTWTVNKEIKDGKRSRTVADPRKRTGKG